MFLVDTNFWLEILLNQQSAAQADAFIKSAPKGNLSISLFSLDSVGVVLSRQRQLAQYDLFLSDLLANKVRLYAFGLRDLTTINQTAVKWNLDFDDAYQYAIAKKYQLQLVSFDKDFDKTELKRIEP